MSWSLSRGIICGPSVLCRFGIVIGVGLFLAGIGTLGGATGVITLGERTYGIIMNTITSLGYKVGIEVFIISRRVWITWSCSYPTENGDSGDG